jgi:hypothetical protein
MKFVSSLPPATAFTKDELEVEGLAPVKAAKPVQPRSLPPLVVQPHIRSKAKASPGITEQQEKRHDVHVHGERRTYCRRTELLPVLVDLRSGFDRRRHNQRKDDITEHVDEKV